MQLKALENAIGPRIKIILSNHFNVVFEEGYKIPRHKLENEACDNNGHKSSKTSFSFGTIHLRVILLFNCVRFREIDILGNLFSHFCCRR